MNALPEIAPIIPQMTTTITPSAPLIFPTNTLASPTSFSAMPLSAIKFPAITNIGTARSEVLIICEYPHTNKDLTGTLQVATRKIKAPAKQYGNGIPINNRINNKHIQIANATITFMIYFLLLPIFL